MQYHANQPSAYIVAQQMLCVIKVGDYGAQSIREQHPLLTDQHLSI